MHQELAEEASDSDPDAKRQRVSLAQEHAWEVPETPAPSSKQEAEPIAPIDDDSDTDSSRNPDHPLRVQWEFHEKGFWRGMMRQDEIESAFHAWNRDGCPKDSFHDMDYRGFLYSINWKKFMQTTWSRNANGSINEPIKVRSIRRILVTHEQGTQKNYK